nr:drug resistance protein [Quercus suber]
MEGALEIAALGLLVTHQLPAAASSSRSEGTDAPKSIFERVDILGSSVSIAGLILLVFALSEGNVVGWDTVEVIVTLIIAIVLIFAFIFIELRVARYPILPKYFWADRIRMLGCIAAALTYAARGTLQQSDFYLANDETGLGFSALSTAVRFLPLGVTAIVVNIVAPIIVKFVNPRPILTVGWTLGLVGVLLLSFIKSQDDYWRFCLPGEILYIAGIGTVNFVGNITVVATAKKEFQGTVSGIFNMFLNVGGAVLGVALLTAISNAVTNAQGGSRNARAALHGYQAGYYTMVGMAGVGIFVAMFYKVKKQDVEQEQNGKQEHDKDMGEENKEKAEARTESVATDQEERKHESHDAVESED